MHLFVNWPSISCINNNDFCLYFFQAYEEAQKRLKMAENDQKNMVGTQNWFYICL